MSEARSDKPGRPNSIKQLKTSAVVQEHRRGFFRKLHETNDRGEPFGICPVNTCEEIFTALDMPVVTNPWWSGLIAAKQMSKYYLNILKSKGYDLDPYPSLGLGCTMDNNPEVAPYGGVPKPTVMVGSGVIEELWAREYGCPYFAFNSRRGCYNSLPVNWWERIHDHWDEIVDRQSIDLKVEELKYLIRFLEITTGRRFDLAKLNEVVMLVNEQEDYWRKTRDLIAETIPCPVSLPDQHTMYGTQWYRGTPEARDHIKMFYEETKERVANGIGACPNEKIRMYWIPPGLWIDTGFYQHFEENYGATFIASVYTSYAADGYGRKVLNNDPLRALASRYVTLGDISPEWQLKEAKAHKCAGAVGFLSGAGAVTPKMKQLFEDAGVPVLALPGMFADSRTWDEAKVNSLMTEFLETRILT